MLAFSALVAGSFSLGAMAAPHIHPLALNAVRFVLAGAVVGALAAATTGLPRRTFRAPWRYLALGGLFSAYFALMFQGLKTAPPVSASAVFTLTPLMAAGFGWLLLRQGLTPRIALGLTIGTVGALWVIFRADLAALASFEVGRGEAIYFVGCAAHALYTPLLARLSRGEPVFAYIFGVTVGGALTMGAVGAGAIAATDWAALPAIVWITLVYLALFASAATFVLLHYAAMRLPASKVMAYTYLTPSWVIAWEVALGHETPRALTLAGIALTVAALALLLRDERQGREPNAATGS